MPSRSDAFFDELGGRGHDPTLRGRTATIRFEIRRDTGTDSWSVVIDRGDISAAPDGDDTADCVIRLDGDLFDDIARGEANALAAMLRGELAADGDPDLMVAARRLLAAPAPAGEAGAGEAGDGS